MIVLSSLISEAPVLKVVADDADGQSQDAQAPDHGLGDKYVVCCLFNVL